jgi:hypothetical protein
MENSDSESIVYRENLNRCGARLLETITLLEEYNKTKNWETVHNTALENNILNKQSDNTIKTILRCVKNRFMDVEDLPSFDQLSLFVSSDIPEKAKIQVLLPYICKTDHLINKYILYLVYNNIQSNNLELSKETFHDFFKTESEDHPELEKWSQNSEVRWVRSLLSILRKFGLMQPAPKIKLEKPQLRMETFGFYCIFFLLSGTSGIYLVKNDLWKLYGLSVDETERFLENAQMKGWIQYHQSGDILSINTEYKSLEGWVNDLE